MIVISGTGRSGTTYLMELFAELGFDTGPWTEAHYHHVASAGRERNVLKSAGYRVVKSPHFCDQVDAAVAAGIGIEHVIIPVRNIEDAAASRVRVQEAATGSRDGKGVPGGLWGTTSAEDQASVLSRKLASLVESLVRHDIPMTMLYFPRITTDEDYLFRKLSPLMPAMTYSAFLLAFAEVARPERVHSFGIAT